MTRFVSIPREVQEAISECRDLIQDIPIESLQSGDDTEFDSLLQRINRTLAEEAVTPKAAIGTIHHFACSGGTIMSKSVAAMPNVCLLSEVDPLSMYGLQPSRPVFAPTDLLRHLRYACRTIDDDIIIDAYLAMLNAIVRKLTSMGMHVVIRDHSHSHFCTDTKFDDRPTHLDVLMKSLTVRPVVTVRNPVESYISLLRNEWESYEPTGFDEYCRRYLAFLELHAGSPVYKFEDFTDEPGDVLRKICDDLCLDYDDHWQSLLSIIPLTGDSGRTSNLISPQAAKPVSEALRNQMEVSKNWARLAPRLGYQLDF